MFAKYLIVARDLRLPLACLAATLLLAGCEGGRSQVPRVMVQGGDAERGEFLIEQIGCGACHEIPGIRGARGVVGPPLTRWPQRSFIAGEVPNSVDNLIRWIVDPHSIEPGTAMPHLGIKEQEARDIAAYLYSYD